jgi:hypothetical protein
MKTQGIIKSGAAMGSAVALLLISVLFAPSPALAANARPNGPTTKLEATGVEPSASGHVHGSGEWFDDYAGTYVIGTVTGVCNGLTPAKMYTIEVIEGWSGSSAGMGSAVASQRGDLKFTCGVAARVQFVFLHYFYIHVVNDAGQVVLEGVFQIHFKGV